MRVTWIQPEDLIRHELAACRYEGRDVDALANRWQQAGGETEPPAKGASANPAPTALRRLATTLLDELDDAGGDHTVAGHPESLDDIAAGWPADWSLPRGPGSDFTDRLHGAWLGRAAGCLLGKPVEGMALEGIRQIMRVTGNAPLSRYFTAIGVPEEVTQRWPWNRRSKGNSLIENIDGMAEDDDLNFPLLALILAENHGRDLTSQHIAAGWLDYLPAQRVFTAERVAYRNLLLGHTPPDTAVIHNPFREWIGAQIRTDLFGWIHPGDPAAAAEIAYRDAAISHVRNGIYGAQFAAAMSAAAMVADDVSTVLDTGQAVVPPASRLAEAIAHARALAESTTDWDTIVDTLHARYRELHHVHVVNNAAVVTAALIHGRGDYSASICATVSAGWDTDSNGATVGGVVGALRGGSQLPGEWTAPLRDTLHTSLPGLEGITFSELATRTRRLADSHEVNQ